MVVSRISLHRLPELYFQVSVSEFKKIKSRYSLQTSANKCVFSESSWVRIFVCGAELAVQSQRRWTCWKSWVFSRRLKVLSDSSGAHSEGGRLFQVAEPNTAKLRWPVEVRTLGKRRVPVVAEQSAIDAFPRLKWPECTDRQGNAALCRVDISTP